MVPKLAFPLDVMLENVPFVADTDGTVTVVPSNVNAALPAKVPRPLLY